MVNSKNINSESERKSSDFWGKFTGLQIFFVFVKKEFYHILRDRRTLLIVLGMPIVQILIFGFAINMEVSSLKIAFYTNDQNSTTRSIVKKIEANPNFISQGYLYSIEQAEDMLKKGELSLVLVFPPNFGNNTNSGGSEQIQLIVDAANPNNGTIAANYVEAIIADYQMGETKLSTIPYRISVESKLLYNPEMKSAYMFVPGVMGLIMLIICAIMTSAAIVREKELGTMEVLLVSPIKMYHIVLGKLVPYFVVSLLNVVTILLLAVYVLQVPIAGSLSLLFLVCTLYILLSLSIGLLISTLVNTQIVAIIISGIGLLLPTLVLSEMIFPISNMPIILQWISHIVPARWFIAIVKKVMIEGLGFYYIIKEVAILTIMFLSLFIVSIRNLKERL